MSQKQFRPAKIKNAQGKTIIGLATTAAMDRDGDIVMPNGIDMTNFRKNPQLLWSHDYMRPPIGRVTKVEVTGRGLEFEAELASDINPFAKEINDLVQAGYLNTVSIGFIPKRFDGEYIVESELLEISLVNIPANQEAIISPKYKHFLTQLTPNNKVRKKYITYLTQLFSAL